MIRRVLRFFFPPRDRDAPAPPAKPAPGTPPGPARRELLSAVLQSLSEGVLAVDAGRRVLLANPALGPLLNRPPADGAGRPLWEILRHRELSELVDRVLARGRDESREMVFTQDAERTFLVRARALRTAGAVDGAVLAFSEITHLRRLENVRKDFVANVSHELKTPLTALRAALETLLDGALEDTAHARDFLQTAQGQVERLEHLIEDLLTLSRLEKPGAPPANARCNVGEVAARVVKALTPLAQKKGVRLSVDAPPDLSAPLTAEELTQILMNLVDNGMKFNRPGGEVAVTARADGGAVEVRVRDTGPGVPAEHRERIFERFYRLDPARSRDTGGTGLGLAIVKHLVENRGGTVQADDAEGGGSVFTVVFGSVKTNQA